MVNLRNRENNTRYAGAESGGGVRVQKYFGVIYRFLLIRAGHVDTVVPCPYPDIARRAAALCDLKGKAEIVQARALDNDSRRGRAECYAARNFRRVERGRLGGIGERLRLVGGTREDAVLQAREKRRAHEQRTVERIGLDHGGNDDRNIWRRGFDFGKAAGNCGRGVQNVALDPYFAVGRAARIKAMYLAESRYAADSARVGYVFGRQADRVERQNATVGQHGRNLGHFVCHIGPGESDDLTIRDRDAGKVGRANERLEAVLQRDAAARAA